jgi:hypothetical protein
MSPIHTEIKQASMRATYIPVLIGLHLAEQHGKSQQQLSASSGPGRHAYREIP